MLFFDAHHQRPARNHAHARQRRHQFGDAAEQQPRLRRRCRDGNSLKRADGCLILEPDVPALIALFKSVDAFAGADAHALGERTDDRCHSRRADDPGTHLPVAVGAVQRRAGCPAAGVAEPRYFRQVFAEFLRARRQVLSAVIERISADASRGDAAADDAGLLENFDEEAGTTKSARARQAREPGADNGRFVCHLIPLLKLQAAARH